MEVVVSVANSEKDMKNIQRFAEEAGVSSEGIEDENTQFLIMTSTDGKMVATIGIEAIDKNALLRTLIADATRCTSQKLFHLFDVAIGTARSQGKQDIYFFTEAKPDMFQILDFSLVEESEIPSELFESNHFKKTMASNSAYLLKSSL